MISPLFQLCLYTDKYKNIYKNVQTQCKKSGEYEQGYSDQKCIDYFSV